MTENTSESAGTSMTKAQVAELIARITEYSGIRVAPVLVNYVSVYVEKQSARLACSCADYCRLLKPGRQEFNQLITEITTNETYFFREQRQFNLLKESVFPRFSGRKMVIWSAASASGEEAVSLYALAAACDVTPKIYATDIDQNELAFFRRGVYTRSSFCEDGKAYHQLLVSSGCGLFDGSTFRLHKSFLEKVEILNYNLVDDTKPPMQEAVNLIFLRNVFIYFDDERRRAVLKKLSSALAPGGLIFLAFSEIGSISADLIPDDMEKVNVGPVYFLVKKDRGTQQEKRPERRVVPVKVSEPPLPSAPSPRFEPKTDFKPPEKASEVFSAVPEPEYMFHVLKWIVTAGEFDVARNMVANYRPDGGRGMYADFFRGYIEKAAGNVSRAEHCLSLAEQAYPDFWPAYFYHGILLKEHSRDNEAIPFFRKCASILEEYERKGCTHFDFLAESFSPAYFSVLCMKFMRTE